MEDLFYRDRILGKPDSFAAKQFLSEWRQNSLDDDKFRMEDDSTIIEDANQNVNKTVPSFLDFVRYPMKA